METPKITFMEPFREAQTHIVAEGPKTGPNLL